MESKKALLLVFLVVILVGFISVVSAATTVNIVDPVFNSSNLTSSSQYLNASIIAGFNITNVTFYYQPYSYMVANVSYGNGNGSWIAIATVQNTSIGQTTFNTTWDTTAIDDGKNYTLNVTAREGDNSVNSSNVTANITIDNTAPTIVIYKGPAATPSAFANGTIKTSTSTNLTLNISVTDATVGLANSSAQFCIIKIDMEFNHSVPLNRSGASATTGWCNSSDINITGLADGNHTVNVTINDTINNLRSNFTFHVQIDTTDPAATAACSPSTVQSGASFPCTCSGTDATSGIDSSATTSTSTSGTTSNTANTGTFTYTCNVADYGGLTGSATATYSVTQPPGTGGGTTTPTWTTHSITEGLFEQGYTKELGVKNRIKVQIEAGDHFIGVVSISGEEATIEISSDPVQVTLAAGEEAKVDVTDDGFYDVYVLLNGITNNKADVTIQKIYEEVPEGGTGVETNGEIVEEPSAEEGGISVWIWILIAVVVIVIAVAFGIKKRR